MCLRYFVLPRSVKGDNSNQWVERARDCLCWISWVTISTENVKFCNDSDVKDVQEGNLVIVGDSENSSEKLVTSKSTTDYITLTIATPQPYSNPCF